MNEQVQIIVAVILFAMMLWILIKNSDTAVENWTPRCPHCNRTMVVPQGGPFWKLVQWHCPSSACRKKHEGK